MLPRWTTAGSTVNSHLPDLTSFSPYPGPIPASHVLAAEWLLSPPGAASTPAGWMSLRAEPDTGWPLRARWRHRSTRACLPCLRGVPSLPSISVLTVRSQSASFERNFESVEETFDEGKESKEGNDRVTGPSGRGQGRAKAAPGVAPI